MTNPPFPEPRLSILRPDGTVQTAAVELDLSAGDVAALDEAVPPGAAAGERYPPGAMKHLHK